MGVSGEPEEACGSVLELRMELGRLLPFSTIDRTQAWDDMEAVVRGRVVKERRLSYR